LAAHISEKKAPRQRGKSATADGTLLLDRNRILVHPPTMINSRRSKVIGGGLILCLVILMSTFPFVFASDQGVPVPAPKGLINSYRYAQSDLGAVYRPEATTLKVWAPTAYSVELMLFADAHDPSFVSVPMQVDPDGIWSVRLEGNQDGKYYLYRVTFQGVAGGKPAIFEVIDPYAHGCSANSGRALIYDPAKTNPAGWEQDGFVPLKNNTDAILYEVHVRDFSINPDSGVSLGQRGKFLGMMEGGTRTPAGQSSGFDHLLDLGVTHVQLLPVTDYADGDERQVPGGYSWYNWGYDPLLYNVPEGSYASDADGTARQKELKRLVQAFHHHGIGVVLDVVFNHTAATGSGKFSIFDKIVPRYYYRKDALGQYANATGCGNEFASEKPMARKFIVDCVKYLMTEYHVDGFRFDLMGILDRETMLEVFREAKRINPSAILYGEGWDMERVLPPGRMMTQAHVQGTGIAAFNDGIRDNIKGDAGDASQPGFVQGAMPPFGGMARFQLNIKGQSTGKNRESIAVDSPCETISYASVHDDLCLWDKLQVSAGSMPVDQRIKMDKLAAGIVMTAQGIPLIHAGDEFLRSKNLVSNSYNDNDPRVNPINWALKDAHEDVFGYYRGLIALRKAHPAFRMTDKATVNELLVFDGNVPNHVVQYVLQNHANGDSWGTILVIYNGSSLVQSLPVDGRWVIVADDRAAGTEALRSVQDQVRVQPFSLLIAHSD
jgi:pullulanase